MPSVFTHDDFQLGGGRADVVTTVDTIDVSVGQWTGAMTYGFTDRMDVSLAVPVVHTSLNVVSAATMRRLGTRDSATSTSSAIPTPRTASGRTAASGGGSASGLGDLIVRVKGTVVRQGPHGLAVGLDVRMPTGDERNLLGRGRWASSPLSRIRGRTSPVTARNFGYQWNGEQCWPATSSPGRRPTCRTWCFTPWAPTWA